MLPELETHLMEKTVNVPLCTQDNSGGLSPSELANFMESAVRFTQMGGKVTLHMASSTALGLKSHPYWSVIIEKTANHSENEGNKGTYSSQIRTKTDLSLNEFNAGFIQLNKSTLLDKSIRSLSISLLKRGDNPLTEILNEIAFPVNPIRLINALPVVSKSATIYPKDLKTDGPDLQSIGHLLSNTGDAGLLAGFIEDLKSYKAGYRQALFDVIKEREDCFSARLREAFELTVKLKSQVNLSEAANKSGVGEKDMVSERKGVPIQEQELVVFYRQNRELFKIEGVNSNDDFSQFSRLLLNELTQLIDDPLHRRIDYIEDYIKRLNSGIQGKEVLTLIVEKIQHKLVEINRSGVLTKMLEINTRNFIQFLTELNKIIDLLSDLLLCIERSRERMQWNTFVESQDGFVKKILQKLELYPVENWVSLYTEAVEELGCNAMIHPLVPDNFDIIRNAMEARDEDWKMRAYADLNGMKQEVAINPKETKPSFLEHTLGKLGWTNQKSEYTQNNNGSFEIDTNYETEKGLLFLFDDGEGRSWKSRFEINDFQNFQQISGIRDRMSEIPLTDRFSVSKAIAQYIQRLNCNVRVFQSKHANILCMMPLEVSSVMIEELSMHGLKEFKGRNSTEDAVIESLLETQRKQILVLFNGLPNDTDFSDIGSQFLLLEKLETIGFNIYSTWSKDILKSKQGCRWLDELESCLVK